VRGAKVLKNRVVPFFFGCTVAVGLAVGVEMSLRFVAGSAWDALPVGTRLIRADASCSRVRHLAKNGAANLIPMSLVSEQDMAACHDLLELLPLAYRLAGLRSCAVVIEKSAEVESEGISFSV